MIILWLVARAVGAFVRRLQGVGVDPPIARPSDFHER
jgi:hypothetical protein